MYIHCEAFLSKLKACNSCTSVYKISKQSTGPSDVTHTHNKAISPAGNQQVLIQ